MVDSSNKSCVSVCTGCSKRKECKEGAISWVYFFVGLIATAAIRAVNVVLDFSPLFAKVLWYMGVGGFLVFFAYKFKYDRIMQKELQRANISDKLLLKKELTEDDYRILGTVVCKLRSKKDIINYFFIFLFSGISLALALYVDLFK